MEAQIILMNDLAKMPKRGSEKSAGYDLYAATDCDILINPHRTAMIGTGLKITPPKGYFGAIFARSGIATKRGLRPANCLGVCDAKGDDIIGTHNKMRILWKRI